VSWLVKRKPIQFTAQRWNPTALLYGLSVTLALGAFLLPDVAFAMSADEQIRACYKLMFQREPGQHEIATHRKRLSPAAPSAVREFCRRLLYSDEYVRRFTSEKTNTKKVEFLYATLVGRQPTKADLAYWVPLMKDPQWVANSILAAEESWGRLYVATKFADDASISSYKTAALLDKNGSKAKALEAMKKIAMQPRAVPESFLYLCENSKDDSARLKWLDKGIGCWSDDPSLRRERAKILMANDNPELAAEDLEVSLRTQIDDTTLSEQRADALTKQGKWKEAVVECCRMDKIAPHITRLMKINLVGKRFSQREYDRGWFLLQEIERTGVRGPDISLLKSEALYHMERYDGAILEAKHCLAKEPNNVMALIIQGRSEKAAERPERALPPLTRAIELEKRPQNYQYRADVYASLKRWHEAEVDLTSALKLNPGDAGRYYARALMFIEQKKAKDAVDDLTKAISIKRDFAGYYQSRALAYRMLHKLDLAHKDEVKARQVGQSWEDKM